MEKYSYNKNCLLLLLLEAIISVGHRKQIIDTILYIHRLSSGALVLLLVAVVQVGKQRHRSQMSFRNYTPSHGLRATDHDPWSSSGDEGHVLVDVGGIW